MRDDHSIKLNELLVTIFQSVLAVEEQTLKNAALDISITELHTLEAVGKCGPEGCTISALAQKLHVTLPTVTVCIKKLEQKEYVEKARSEVDGRMVHIILTRKGRKIDAVHRYFHEQMVRAFLKEVDESEHPIIIRAVENLHSFLERHVEEGAAPLERERP